MDFVLINSVSAPPRALCSAPGVVMTIISNTSAYTTPKLFMHICVCVCCVNVLFEQLFLIKID
jgi:hypothetical protein